MNKIRLIGIIGVFLAAMSFPAAASGADVRAFVDRTQAALGESINFTVTAEGEDIDVDLSGIRDFKVVPRGTSTSIQVVNGRMTRAVKKNYVLIPRKEGRLVIPPLGVAAAGKTYRTRAIVVQVSKQPRVEADAQDLFVRVRVAPEKPYEGQQIVYTFSLYTAVRLANAKFQKPEFSGFDVKEIDQARTFQKVVSGREYTVSELAYLLVPLKTGPIVIEPGTFSCDFVQQRARRRPSFLDGFWDDSFFGQAELQPRLLTTDPVTVDVRPLPDLPGNIEFSGLVGRFELQAVLENAEIKVGDSATLSVTLSGTGNIMDATAPRVTVPDAFKVYTDTPQDEIVLDRSGFSGKKVFRFALVAVKPGIYSIDPVRTGYFDVSKEEYLALSTQPFSLTVIPSDEKEKVEVFSVPSTTGEAGFKKKKVEFVGRDILPLKEDLDAIENRAPMGVLRFIVLLAAPVLLFAASKTFARVTRKSRDARSRMARRAETALKHACKPGTSTETFLADLYRSLISALFSVADSKGESLTYAEAAEILEKNGHPLQVGAQAVDLLKKIESARYGGMQMDASARADLLAETRRFVRSLLK